MVPVIKYQLLKCSTDVYRINERTTTSFQGATWKFLHSEYYFSYNFSQLFFLYRTLYRDITYCNMINNCFFSSNRIAQYIARPTALRTQRSPLALFAPERNRCKPMWSYSALLPSEMESLTHFLAH